MTFSQEIEELLIKIAAEEEEDDTDESSSESDAEKEAEESDDSETPIDDELANILSPETPLVPPPPDPQSSQFQSTLPKTLWNLTESGPGYIVFQKEDSKSDAEAAAGRYTVKSIMDTGKPDSSIIDFVKSFMVANKIDIKPRRSVTGRSDYGPTVTDFFDNNLIQVVTRWDRGKLLTEIKWDPSDKAVTVPPQFKTEDDLPDSLKPNSGIPEQTAIPDLTQLDQASPPAQAEGDMNLDELFKGIGAEESEESSDEAEAGEASTEAAMTVKKLTVIANIMAGSGLSKEAATIASLIKKVIQAAEEGEEILEDTTPEDTGTETPKDSDKDRIEAAKAIIASNGPESFISDVLNPAIEAGRISKEEIDQLNQLQKGNAPAYASKLESITKKLTRDTKEIVRNGNPSLADQLEKHPAELFQLTQELLKEVTAKNGGRIPVPQAEEPINDSEPQSTEEPKEASSKLKDTIIQNFMAELGEQGSDKGIQDIFQQVVKDSIKETNIEPGADLESLLKSVKENLFRLFTASGNTTAADAFRQ